MGPWPNDGLFGDLFAFFFGKNVSGASSCHVPIQKQNGLDVVDQDDMLFSLS